MGLFNVPQFIDIEDKIVGPLTAKQLGWVAIGFFVLLLSWFFLDFSAFILAAVIVGAIFGALAFYKPNGQSFIVFASSAFFFFFKPKIYVWRRIPEKIQRTIKPMPKKNAIINVVPKKEELNKNIKSLSDLLDSKSKF